MIAVSASAPTTLDIRALPGSRETVAYQGGGQFPVLTLATDGTIVAVLRGGAGHLGLAGRIEVIRSLDAGQSWSPPAVVADSEWDDRNPAIGLSPAGTVILSYHRTGCYDEQGNYASQRRRDSDVPVEVMVTRSFDDGLTWEQPRTLGVPALQTSSPFGKIVTLPDSTLLMATYGRPREEIVDSRANGIPEGHNCAYLVRSTDDGATWGNPTLISADEEPGLVALPNGELIVALRRNPPDSGISIRRSADGGVTWSAPTRITESGMHPADMIVLADGSVLLTYGNRNPPYRVEGRISEDGGRTWRDLLFTFSGHLYGYNVTAPRRTDLGYPSSVVHPRSRQGVTMYYYNPSLPPTGDWRTEERGVFYRAENYRAIAMTWSEAELIGAIASRH